MNALLTMLRASADVLESSCRVQMLAIRERELLFFSKNCWLIANLSALLAGFGYTGLVYTKYIDSDLCDPQEILCAEMTYPIVVTITMGLSLFSLWGSMLITMLAPAMALKGPQGSLNRCVDIMVQEYQYMLFLFACAIAMLMVSTIIWSMTQRLQSHAVSVTFLTLLFFYLLYLTALQVLLRFEIPSRKLVTGRFTVYPFRAQRRVATPPHAPHHRADNRHSHAVRSTTFAEPSRYPQLPTDRAADRPASAGMTAAHRFAESTRRWLGRRASGVGVPEESGYQPLAESDGARDTPFNAPPKARKLLGICGWVAPTDPSPAMLGAGTGAGTGRTEGDRAAPGALDSCDGRGSSTAHGSVRDSISIRDSSGRQFAYVGRDSIQDSSGRRFSYVGRESVRRPSKELAAEAIAKAWRKRQDELQRQQEAIEEAIRERLANTPAPAMTILRTGSPGSRRAGSPRRHRPPATDRRVRVVSPATVEREAAQRQRRLSHDRSPLMHRPPPPSEIVERRRPSIDERDDEEHDEDSGDDTPPPQLMPGSAVLGGAVHQPRAWLHPAINRDRAGSAVADISSQRRSRSD